MKQDITSKKLKTKFETIYQTYNRKCYIHPDPLEFIYKYKNKRDREIVGLIAASLAYGRVAQILKSISTILSVTTPSPYRYLKERKTVSDIQKDFQGFRHRFASSEHIASLLWGIKQVNDKYGSLENCFEEGFKGTDESTINALEHFVNALKMPGLDAGHLIPLPSKGSSCKRLNLYLRWMIRDDHVDPHVWKNIPPSKLIIPLDTHMHKIAIHLGFTRKKQANMKTALEITENMKCLSPEDPVKYDFSLTRFGIRDDMTLETLFSI